MLILLSDCDILTVRSNNYMGTFILTVILFVFQSSVISIILLLAFNENGIELLIGPWLKSILLSFAFSGKMIRFYFIGRIHAMPSTLIA